MSFDVTALPAYTEQHAMDLIVKSVAGGRLSQYANFVNPIATGLPTTIGTSSVQANPFSTALGGALVGGQFGGAPGALLGGGLGLLGGLL